MLCFCQLEMSTVYVILLFSHLTAVLLSAGNANGHHDECPDSFDCGSLGRIYFPFTTVQYLNCGALAIHGCDDHNQTAVKRVQLNNGGKLFQVTQVNSHQRQGWRTSISITDHDFRMLLVNGSCMAFTYNIIFPPFSAFGYFDMKNNITSFKCRHNQTVNHTNDFINYTNDFINYTSTRCPSSVFYFAPPSYYDQSLRSLISLCSMVKLPVRQDSQFIKNPFGFLNAEITFEFQFSSECHQCYNEERGDHCRLDSNGTFYCAKR